MSEGTLKNYTLLGSIIGKHRKSQTLFLFNLALFPIFSRLKAGSVSLLFGSMENLYILWKGTVGEKIET